MSSNKNDPAAAFTWLVIGLVLIYMAFVALIALLALTAVFIIGWYLTHLLIRLADEASEGELRREHSGLVLLLSGLFWALVGWLFIPTQWLYFVADLWPAMLRYPYLPGVVGGVLGLTWAMLVLFAEDEPREVDPLDLAGMYSIPERALLAQEPDAIDLLTDAIILGTDEDASF